MRVPVILHGRMGDWSRQLRPRLHDLPVRWFESRSSQDLKTLLGGLAFPLVLIDAGRERGLSLRDLGRILIDAPRARVLVLDPDAVPGFALMARELGAAHVFSGFVPPPVVASLLSRWILISRSDIARAGWSRTTFPETQTDPWSWLSDYVGEPVVFSRSGSAPWLP